MYFTGLNHHIFVPAKVTDPDYGHKQTNAAHPMYGWMLDVTLNSQWLSVKLAKEYAVLRVVFVTRADCCSGSFLGMRVLVGDQAGLDQPMCGQHVEDVYTYEGRMVGISCNCLVTGSYVTLNPIIDPPKSAGIGRVAVFGLDPELF